ncbi:PaaI family thioesterase [Agromyces seonyuensis]|uniref:Hotdog fold thioesterase n=1 Tax=Agromyces seonyuensis TaxID=2662446 RepID=A0A6I4NX09_9MICO|nr:PaaI family thioesterase [Agromyces seonyuensis]MWB97035.1 hotdog fold thioesterase [Agromyces seonyuensis]
MEPQHTDPTRERSIHWEDTAVGLAALPTTSGIDYLRAIRDGELPPAPIASAVLMRLTTVEDGRAEFECTPDESLYNPIGSVHGGLLCTILDSALGCAGHTTLPAGTGYTTIELKVSFLRPARAGHRLTARGRVVKPGRRVIFVEGEVVDADGETIATATASLLAFPIG